MKFCRLLVMVGGLFAGLGPQVNGEVAQKRTRGGLPLFSISTEGEEITKEEAISAKIRLHRHTLDGQRQPYVEATTALGKWLPIEIKRRGFSSNLYKKKQYQFKFLTAEEKADDLPLLDMPAGKKWVLNGPYVDRTQMRNALVYQWGDQLASSREGSPWFAPQLRFVEIELNGEYKGIYGLTERIERGKNRLNVKKIDIEHLDAIPHYVMKLESFRQGVRTQQKTLLNWVYPSDSDLEEWRETHPAEVKVLEGRVLGHIDAFEAALKGADFADPVRGYRPFIDRDSFVDYMIIQEVAKNTDAYRKSAYFHLANDGKIHMGPLWDFDLALGNLWFFHQHTADGWNFNRNHFYHGNRARFWFKRLMADPDFSQAYYQRYQELRHKLKVFDDGKLDHEIAVFSNSFGNAEERNFAKWGKIRNPLFRIVMNRPPFPKGYGRNVEMMKSWLHKRLQWMDVAIEQYK